MKSITCELEESNIIKSGLSRIFIMRIKKANIVNLLNFCLRRIFDSMGNNNDKQKIYPAPMPHTLRLSCEL